MCGIDDEDNLMKNKVSDVYDDNDIEIEMARSELIKLYYIFMNTTQILKCNIYIFLIIE